MVWQFAGRMRRGVTGTAVAAAAMAALTASQAPGAVGRAAAPHAERPDTPPGQAISGDTTYFTALPPLRTAAGGPGAPAPRASRDTAVASGGAVPATVLDAYRKAETAQGRSAPRCRLSWQLLAAIGQVESAQARGGRVDAEGTTYTPILGPQLNGRGFAMIRDTDGGAYDGDTVYDRAVGPMQFIPSTWAVWGADGNGDGRADPHNVYDAALAAGRYLCAGGRDLSDPYDLDRAILGYNHSREYLHVVMSWFAYFRSGHHVVPDGGGTAPRTEPRPSRSSSPAAPSPSPSPTPTSSPAPSASPSPSSSPSPTAERPGGATESGPPLVTGPGTGVELPDGGLLPTAGPLTGNG
ncbi:lytic transglycosylase domain-containing protein [Streptomyces vilmorinianum]|uniref:lytic transglycosylase domain-containing protein n=1 Tax=Streptomyces vilmorinianum TaxID=3051092 RepID=UPI0020C7C96F|nr:lytic transglycosylase domain-containing protein [Streptomyces vilmorinianum]